MRIISFAAIKGGVGKTTLTFNFGEWLAQNGSKVLLIDTDHQCSLSQTYGYFTNEDTVYNIFTAENVTIRNISDNLDLIPSSPMLDELENELSTKHNKDLLLMMWLQDNVAVVKNYDYILIDCHPDFLTVTKNAVAVSHYILSPIEPSQYGYISKDLLSERLALFKNEVIDAITRESYITAIPYFLGNRIRHNTKSSKEFSLKIENDSSVIALIPEKELFNRSTLDNIPIVEMQKDSICYKNNADFFKIINSTFKKIKEYVDE